MLEIEDRALINLICSLIVSVVGITGNALILKFFANHHKERPKNATNRPYTTNKITTYHLCILHLAFADFLTCILSVVWSTYQYVNYSVLETRIDGSVKLTFNFIYLIFFVASMTSSGISFILSLERYFKIAFPFKNKIKKPVIHVLCALFYLSSIVAAFPTDYVIKNDIQTELLLNTIFYIFGIIILLVIPVVGKKKIHDYFFLWFWNILSNFIFRRTKYGLRWYSTYWRLLIFGFCF